MKRNVKAPLCIAGWVILILAVLLAAGCDDLLDMFAEEEALRSWVDDLPETEKGTYSVQFITSHLSLVAANPSYKIVRPPETKVDGMPAEPAWSNHTFIGWYDTTEETGGTRFTADTVVNRSWKLYGRWFDGTPTTVKFNGNGGTPAEQVRTVTPPVPTVLDWPDDPTPPGGNPFSGWYTESNGGLLFTSSTTVPYSTTITVYAQYGDKYTVTFDKNGGETEANPQTMSVFGSGSTLSSLPAPPALTDKVFAGWFDTSESAGGNQFTTSTGITGDITVYARWNDPPPSTVTFNLQGGSGVAPLTREVPYKAAIGSLPTPTTPRANLSFAGWYTQANSGGVKYSAETVVTANVTLYARWKGLVLWYKFARNGATITDASGGFPYTGSSWTSHNGTLKAGGASGANLTNHTANSNPKISTQTINGKSVPVMETASSSVSPQLDMGASVGTDIIRHLDEEFTIAAFIYTYESDGRTTASFLTTQNLTTATQGGIILSHTIGKERYGITKTNYNAATLLSDSYTTARTMIHLAFTQTGKTGTNNGKLYINGVLRKEGNFTLLPADIGATTYNTLGRPYNNGSDYMGYPSYLGDFRIYNRALSQSEIQALSNASDY
jgi:uncharacterized repeat protein (TIGR02543 family)